MHWLTHMDWPSRLAWGLLAWPVTIGFAIFLGNTVQPGQASNSALVLIAGTGVVVAAFTAIIFTVWAIITWFERGD